MYATQNSEDIELTEKIGGLLDVLAYKLPAMKQAEKEVDRYLCRKHNIFNYISPDELTLSWIISDLLNIQGDHGQGDMFLKLFLKTFLDGSMAGIKDRHNYQSRVFLEEVTDTLSSNRRIDIVLRFNDGAMIGIENKPWAYEQKNQLQDYNKDLKNRTKSTDYALIYLVGSPEVQEPACPPEGLIRGTYRKSDNTASIEQWVTECVKYCRAPRFAIFLEDFLSYIQTTFEI